MTMTTPSAQPAQLPDVNRLTSPYPLVQHLLDQAANFVFFAVPDRGYSERQATLTPGHPDDYFGIHGGYGLDARSALHPFEAEASPRADGGLRVTQQVGAATGTLSGRFLIGPDDIPWTPGKLPPATLFDPWRAQSFALVDVEITIAPGHGVRGYAVGRTHPVVVAGRPYLLAGAVGNVREGFGRLSGMQGTFALNGSFTQLGFRGHVDCRILDPDGRLRSEREPESMPAVSGVFDDPEGGVTYVLMRGEKADPNVRTEYGPPPAPGHVSLVTPAQMRAVRYRQHHGHDGPRCAATLGPLLAELVAEVHLDILAPPGSDQQPNAFTTHNEYTFGGGAGVIEAGVALGRSFGLSFPTHPEQPAMRYGGVGPVVAGRGSFEGVQGLLSVNSAIGITPHALSMVNVLQLVDPEGRWRAGGHR